MKPINFAAASISRRQFVTGAAGTTAAVSLGWGAAPAAAQSRVPHVQPQLEGASFNLDIGYQSVNFTGARRTATTVNGSLPAPVLRWREGDRLSLHVRNHLSADSSIHWHGIILPTDMDGVPGMSFAGIKPGQSYHYEFDLNQSGTYWYHSHSDFQEQTGLYGAIIIEPRDPDPVEYDRDHVVLLSDWSDESPHAIYANLKKQGHYYNFQERTAADLWQDIREKGVWQTWKDRAMWNQMRMSDRDIADVTGYTYTYLMNGITPAEGWMGLFNPGEKVRLRFINASAMSIFDVRIPGLKMTLVAADGQNVQPVSIDEFRIGTAETYDVVVQPEGAMAYTLFAQSIDRSGYAWGTLTADPSVRAEIPAMDPVPVLGHEDMGMAHASHDMSSMTNGSSAEPSMDHSTMDHSTMDHSTMDHSTMDHSTMDHSTMDHSTMDHSTMDHSTMDHSTMDHSTMDHSTMDHSTMDHSTMDHSTHGMQVAAQRWAETGLGKAGMGSNAEINHAAAEFGVAVDMRAQALVSGLHDPGLGLREHMQQYGRKVLTYADLKNLGPTLDRREPGREIQLHLTGNMHRYMWSFDGVAHHHAEPIRLQYGERVRFTLVNDTMMTHPIHLHGLWSELETGDPEAIPRKHTVLVQPGKSISYLVTADAPGRWAFHCHLLYHMPGMMREVWVESPEVQS